MTALHQTFFVAKELLHIPLNRVVTVSPWAADSTIPPFTSVKATLAEGHKFSTDDESPEYNDSCYSLMKITSAVNKNESLQQQVSSPCESTKQALLDQISNLYKKLLLSYKLKSRYVTLEGINRQLNDELRLEKDVR